LSGSAIEFLRVSLVSLGTNCPDTILDLFIPPLLKCSAKANKIFVIRATSCLVDIAKHCKPIKVIFKLAESLSNPSKTMRIAIASAFSVLFDNFSHETDPIFMTIIQECTSDATAAFNLGLVDSSPEVRLAFASSFSIFKNLFPNLASA
jgi:hypothetical protein